MTWNENTEFICTDGLCYGADTTWVTADGYGQVFVAAGRSVGDVTESRPHICLKVCAYGL